MVTLSRYKMGTLARLTGLAPVLLRAWERRHGLLLPERTEGGHRLYTEEDLRVLRRVQELIAQGRAIGEVAALGRDALLGGEVPDVARPGEPGAAWTEGALRLRDDLIAAALQIDAGRAERALDEAFAALAPERAIELVVEPALRRVGDLWGDGRCSVAGEHLVANLALGRLQRLFEAARAQALGARALCACFPDEQHGNGALAVAYWLARRGHRVTWLGPALPFEDLERAIERLAPEAVFLSVSRRALLETNAPGLLEVLRRHPGPRFYVGGAGASEGDAKLAAAGAALVPIASFGELSPEVFSRPAPAPRRARARPRR